MTSLNDAAMLRILPPQRAGAGPWELQWPSLSGRVGRLFRDPQDIGPASEELLRLAGRAGLGAADVQEDDKIISMVLDLPGLAKEDVKVHSG